MKIDRRRTQQKKGDKRFATKPRAVTCARCGSGFTRTAPSQIHCSPKCRLLSGIKVSASGCWEWQKSTVRRYGCIRMGKYYEYTHRLSWAVFKGAMPDSSILVLHNCDNPPCCNPDHLRLGTHADNMGDVKARGRSANLGRVMPEWQRKKISETKLARRKA